MKTEFYRFEFKYEMEPFLAQKIEKEIRRYGMKTSKNAQKAGGQYFVTSLYFDSWDLNDYYDKLGGFLRRKKVRARIYEPQLDTSKIVWLELKKKYDMRTHKIRVGLSPSEWKTFLEKGPTALIKLGENPYAKIDGEIIDNLFMIPLKPSVLIRYLRKPYMSNLDFNDLRITFDWQIEACKTNGLNFPELMTPVRNKGVIMEVKFESFMPFWLKRIIQNYNLVHDAYSKYFYSIDAINRHNPLPV